MVLSLVSPSPLTRPATATDSTGNLTPTTSASTSATWTSEQERRLAYCQDQLKQAQKKWSDRQELWIREVDHLLEQKRLYLKSQKISKERLWKRTRSWKALSRTQSAVDTTYGKDDDGDEDGEREREEEEGGEEGEEEEEEEEEGLALGKGGVGSGRGRGVGVVGMRRSESMPQAIRPSHSSFSPTTTTTTTTSSSSFSPPTPTSTNLNPFKKIIRRMSTATGGGRRNSDSVAGSGSGEAL